MIQCAISVEVIDTIEEFRAFETDWRTFQSYFPPATPFQTPEWLLTWWAHFGSGKLQVLIFRFGADIAGVLPCFLHEWNSRRQLTLVGTGVSDYLDPIFDPSHSLAILDALARYLAECQGWDVCDLQDLCENTPLEALGPTIDDTPCSEVIIPADFEEFLGRRPNVLNRNLRTCARLAASLGDLHFEVTQRADDESLNRLIELHEARWRDSGQPGVIESNHAASFLREVAKVLAAQDMVRIFSLRLDHTVVATILALRNETTLFSYLTAFAPEYRKYGFGHEVLARALRYACEHGYRWNFLRGEEPYKAAWGADRIAKRRLILTR